MTEWYHQQRCNKINVHSEDTIVMTLRHVVTLFSVTVTYPQSSTHFVPESDHLCNAPEAPPQPHKQVQDTAQV